ncbi:MAG: hypothetical protein ACI9JE_001003 [Candidatus Krumholzibacteriia bacterium]
MIVGEVLLQHAPQMLFVENDDMVQAFPPDGADHPFAVAILPRRTRRGDVEVDQSSSIERQDHEDVEGLEHPFMLFSRSCNRNWDKVDGIFGRDKAIRHAFRHRMSLFMEVLSFTMSHCKKVKIILRDRMKYHV